MQFPLGHLADLRDIQNYEFHDFHEIFKIKGSNSKSSFRGHPGVKIQQKVANWKAEIHGFPTVEESASEDITIKTYGDFEIRQFSSKFTGIH